MNDEKMLLVIWSELKKINKKLDLLLPEQPVVEEEKEELKPEEQAKIQEEILKEMLDYTFF